MNLPKTKPRDDPETLWALQVELLSMAEPLLGHRDMSKKVLPARFAHDGPRIRHTPNLDGAFVVMSRAGGGYWPTVIFEMAHETVHLLNPVVGNTNNLEEGVAVAFSLHVQPLYNVNIKPSIPSYLHAFRLTCKLPGGPLQSAKRIRDHIGALSEVTAQDLQKLFPSVDTVDCLTLAEQFSRGIY